MKTLYWLSCPDSGVAVIGLMNYGVHVYGLAAQSPVMSNSLQLHGLSPVRHLCAWDCTNKNTGVRCHFLLLQNVPLPKNRTRVSCIEGGFFTDEPQGSPF